MADFFAKISGVVSATCAWISASPIQTVTEISARNLPLRNYTLRVWAHGQETGQKVSNQIASKRTALFHAKNIDAFCHRLWHSLANGANPCYG